MIFPLSLTHKQARVGNVGGNTLGFFGGVFSPDGCSILAHGYQGAFNQWSLDPVSLSLFFLQCLSVFLPACLSVGLVL